MSRVIQVAVEKFPAQLKALREEREITQKELADRAKVSQQTISAIENGRMDPSLKIMLAIAIVFGVILLIGSAANLQQRQDNKYNLSESAG